MKFALHDYRYTELRAGDDRFVGEVIAPYLSQYDAFNKLKREVANGHRVLFDLNTGVLEKVKAEDLARELLDLVAIHNNDVAFMTPIAADALSKKCPNIVFSPEYAARTYQEALSLYNVGVREIYVTGGLAASLEDLRRLSMTMKLRMIPNVVQSNAFRFGNPGAVDPLKCFWVRPEALHLYENVIDTIEFASDEKRGEAGLLAVYARELWLSKLGEIIVDPTGCLDAISNRYTDAIDEVRSRCGLHCQIDGSCHTCQHIELESNLMATDETEK